MKLITKKSECKRADSTRLVKSPKDAIRKTLSNYEIKDGLIIKAYLPSYVSENALVLRNGADCEFSIMLDTNKLASYLN
ncbi:MAG: hypothetical protein K0Q79_996 [Flavipsychrobacter sp.]|jgi:hypothetical protein|nr:hypothetical protein [Flavipsychrobacter sp.]